MSLNCVYLCLKMIGNTHLRINVNLRVGELGPGDVLVLSGSGFVAQFALQNDVLIGKL